MERVSQQNGGSIITKNELARLEDSITFDEKEDELIEVRTSMRPEQVALLKRIMFETDSANLDLIRDLIFEFGSTLHTVDYVGRKIFICLYSLLQKGTGQLRQI